MKTLVQILADALVGEDGIADVTAGVLIGPSPDAQAGGEGRIVGDVLTVKTQDGRLYQVAVREMRVEGVN